ncbi:hypothetical protein V8G54_005611, partial [Vigna mungo]
HLKPCYLFLLHILNSREILCLLTLFRNWRSHSNFHRFCTSQRVREVTEESEHTWCFLQDNDSCLKLCVLTLYLSPLHHLYPFHFLFIYIYIHLLESLFIYFSLAFPFVAWTNPKFQLLGPHYQPNNINTASI